MIFPIEECHCVKGSSQKEVDAAMERIGIPCHEWMGDPPRGGSVATSTRWIDPYSPRIAIDLFEDHTFKC